MRFGREIQGWMENGWSKEGIEIRWFKFNVVPSELEGTFWIYSQKSMAIIL